MPRRFMPVQVQAHPEALAGAGRRFVLVMVATLLAVSAVLASYLYVQQAEYNRSSFQNMIWDGVQFRHEYQAFRISLTESLAGLPGGRPEDVQRRYDSLSARLAAVDTPVYRVDAELDQVLQRITKAIRDWGAAVAAYRSGDKAAGQSLATAAQALNADFSLFASQVNAVGIQQLEASRQRLSRLYTILIGAGVVTWLLVLGFAYALMRQLRATDAAHAGMQAMTADLEQARRLAEDASRTKSNFLATMSHELRTPLNAILGFTDIMRQGLFGAIGNPRYADYLDGIQKSGQHLLALINDVLDMSRIEAGRLELNEREINVALAVDQALALVGVTADGKGVTLESRLPAILPKLLADERIFRQILLNLLSNAIKFTPEGGSVEVTAAVLSDHQLAIRVRDTGIGMSDHQLKQAFEPFSHGGDSLRARETGGSGLGLPITRRLIELHGGEIRLASRKSAGTTATLIFPAARVRPLVGTV
jgi:signal transduction histidine kinase